MRVGTLFIGRLLIAAGLGWAAWAAWTLRRAGTPLARTAGGGYRDHAGSVRRWL